jgi:phospholipase/lecithinase/hemolysin
MKTCSHRSLIAFALVASCSLPLSAQASLTQLTSLFVFGDSLSDGGNSGLRTQQYTGNPAAAYPPPPYYNGQYSNGPVAVEYLWNLFNPGNTTGFTPSLAGGTNYAIGGATTGSANYNTVNADVPPFLQPAYQGFGNAGQLQQFQQYLGGGGTFDPATSLFVVWLFPNDVFAAAAGLSAGIVPGSPGGADLITNGIANILTTIQTLTALGARHFLVPNMPDLGDTPALLGDALLSGLTALFNANLAQQLTLLDQFLPSEIVQFDTAAVFDAILQNPGAYGFSNWTQGCVLNFGFGPGQCNPTNWDTWLFWDGVHPTTATHRLLGAGFRAAVPEPATLGLIAAALFALAWLRRTRRA